MNPAALLVPLEPDRDRARAEAAVELARPEYRASEPGLVQRVITWVLDQLSSLSLPSGPGGAVGTALLVVLVVAAVALLLRAAGRPEARGGRGRGGDVFGAARRTAQDHRRAADEAAGRGDLRTAALERFRAIVREVEERGLLDEQPGRTATEAARAAGTALPGLAAELSSAAGLFDAVRYGDRPVSDRDDAGLRDLDAAVRSGRPTAAAAGSGASGSPRA